MKKIAFMLAIILSTLFSMGQYNYPSSSVMPVNNLFTIYPNAVRLIILSIIFVSCG